MEDFDHRQSVFSIFVRPIMDELEALTNTKNWKVDTLLVLLLFHVVPDALGRLVEV